ncbi:MAG: hypothetical protein ACK4GD_06555 [Sphingomonadaceae bacterium]
MTRSRQVLARSARRDDSWPGARVGGWMLCLMLAGMVLAAGAVLGYNAVVRFEVTGLALMLAWLASASLTLGGGKAAPGWTAPVWAGVIGLVAIAVALRVCSAVLTQDVTLGADPMNYTHLAQAVRDGRGLVTDDWRYGDGLRAYFPPFYPLALAGYWGLFGASPASTLAMNTLIDLVAAWALADAARRIGLGQKAQAVALLYLAWPAFALAAGIPQKESLTIMLLVLLLRGMLTWLQAGAGDREIIMASGLAAGMVSVLILALFAHEPEATQTYAAPDLLLLLCIPLIYWLNRIWMMARRGEVEMDPVAFAVRDRRSIAIGAIMAALFLMAQLGPHISLLAAFGLGPEMVAH